MDGASTLLDKVKKMKLVYDNPPVHKALSLSSQTPL